MLKEEFASFLNIGVILRLSEPGYKHLKLKDVQASDRCDSKTFLWDLQ